jgi:iron complex outermembrane receptor protein
MAATGSRAWSRVAICAAIWGGVIAAANAAEPPTSDASSASLEEVVVTAERRSQNIQTTSIAMTALSAEELANKGVRDQTDLQFAAPSLSMTQVGFTENVNIRGIGINLQSPVVVSGVALYRDGLFYPGNIMADEPYYDVADVEILRGPQGTFVGQNSTGGAILVTSKSPTFDGTHADIEVQAGNYQEVQVRGAVNLPVSDTWGARVAFNHESRNSFFEDVQNPSVHPGKVDQTNMRFGLLFAPNDNFSALWKSEYNTNSTDGYPQRPIPGTVYAGLAPANLWQLNYDRTDLRNDERSIRTGLEVKYRFPDGISLRSISGFQYGQLNMLFDEDATNASTPGSPLPGSYQPQFIHERVTTQEFDVLSPEKGFFRWVLGGSYMHRDVPVEFTTFTQAGAGTPFPVGTPVEAIDVAINNPSDAFGLFGQGTFELSDALELQAGLRYSHDWIGSRGRIVVEPNLGNGLVPVADIPNTTPFSDHKITGKVGLNYKLGSNHFLYAFAANGYKTGGPNPASTAVFQPESVWDYEAGWKGTLLGGHVRTQLGGFFMNYDNFQAQELNTITGGGQQTVFNLQGTSRIYGAELQLQARVSSWSFDAAASYVHSSLGAAQAIDLRALPNGGNGLGPQCAPGATANCFDYTPYFQDINGSQNPYSPKITANVGAQYAFQLPRGVLTPRLDFSYIGKQFTTIFNNPALDLLEVRHLLNAQLGYQLNAWQIGLFATNLTNQTYVTGQQGNNEFLGAPRQYGVRFGTSF